MKILVTGGSGFIGHHVTEELARRGHTPVIFDRHRFPTDLTRYAYEVTLGDIRDETAIHEAISHVDGVIHLAGVLGTQETINHPQSAAETNIMGGLNVLQAIRFAKIPAVYIAVGNHWMNNTYSITKTAVERFAHMFNTEHDTRIRVVRALNAYGPGQSIHKSLGGTSPVRKIMPSFIAQALKGDPITVYGDGSQIMDMIYVTDVAKILCDALFNTTAPYDTVYEAGTGRPTTVQQIAQMVLTNVGGGKIQFTEMRPGEPEQSVVIGDPATLIPLGWTATRMVPLEQGIIHAVENIRTRINP